MSKIGDLDERLPSLNNEVNYILKKNVQCHFFKLANVHLCSILENFFFHSQGSLDQSIHKCILETKYRK